MEEPPKSLLSLFQVNFKISYSNFKIINFTLEKLSGLLAKSQVKLNENFNKVAPYCFFYYKNVEKSKAISEALRKAYLPLKTIDVRSFEGLSQLYSDGTIGYPLHKFVHLTSNYTDVYHYKFTYIGRFSLHNYPHNKPYGSF